MKRFRRLEIFVTEFAVVQFLSIHVARFDRLLTPVSIIVFIALMIGLLIAPSPEDISWQSNKIMKPTFTICLIHNEPATGMNAACAAKMLSEPELFQ